MNLAMRTTISPKRRNSKHPTNAPGGEAGVDNIDCQDADRCVRAICDIGTNTCANHQRFYGAANNDAACQLRIEFGLR